MINKLPCLILKNSRAIVRITNSEIEDGHEKILTEWEGRGQFSQTSKRIQNKEGIWVPLVGKFYIDEEIAEDVVFSGLISVNGSEFFPFSGKKLLNPDGSFHHIELEVQANG